MTAALAISMGVMAQEKENDGQQQAGNMNQTEMIQRRTDAVVKKYGLNEEQAGKLFELNKKYADKMGPRRGPRPQGRMGRPHRMNRDSIQANRNMKRPEHGDSAMINRPGKMPLDWRKTMEAYDTELKAILTEQQYGSYQNDRKSRMQQGGRGPRR